MPGAAPGAGKPPTMIIVGGTSSTTVIANCVDMPIMIMLLLLLILILMLVLWVNRSPLGQHVLPGASGSRNDADFRVIYTPYFTV